MRLLAKKVRDEQQEQGAANRESTERMLERLSRAGDEARKSAQERGKDSEAARAAKALAQAAEAMQRGDREAAAKMLEEAAARADAMEKERAEMAAEAEAVAEILEKSGALEQAIQLAMLGREGSDGEGKEGEGAGAFSKEGEGKSGPGKPGQGALAAISRPPRRARRGPTGRARRARRATDNTCRIESAREARAALIRGARCAHPPKVGESLSARFQAIQGLGRGSEPPASYREVFPAYDAAAEEGIADERVPARRRAAVRRYFQGHSTRSMTRPRGIHDDREFRRAARPRGARSTAAAAHEPPASAAIESRQVGDAERELDQAREVGERIRTGLEETILGQRDVVSAVVAALLAGGHVLLEGAPGLGKTHIVRTLSSLIGGSFARIQFTPDLMPSDVVGPSLGVATEGGGKDLA